MKQFASDEGILRTLDVVHICVRGKTKPVNIYIKALCLPFLCSPLQNQDLKLTLKTYPYFKNLQLAENDLVGNNLEIDILIGMDNYYKFMTGRIIRKTFDGPVALESNLGWFICGPTNITAKRSHTASNYYSTHVIHNNALQVDNDSLKSNLMKFWEFEGLGVGENDVYCNFQNKVYHDGKRYVVALPFKPFHDTLPDNYSNSEKRLDSLKRLLDKDEALLHEYNNIIYQYLKDGIIQKVTGSGLPGRIHYMPHTAVICLDKDTTKVRIVFDASSKNGKHLSLNDCLYFGPCLLTLLFDILVRFRLHKIAIISDIKQAFLNFGISPSDQDYLRFIWFDDVFSQNPKKIMFCFKRVVFGLTCSPFLLNATIREHLKNYAKEFENFVSQILCNLYVDDTTTGFDNVPDAFEFYKRAQKVMKEGGFELAKWASNSKELINLIKSQVDIPNTEQYRKVLGLSWDTKLDELVFSFDELVDEALKLPRTKDSLLSISSKIYDPLGVLIPITIQSKMMFQRICTEKMDWDDLLPNDVWTQWYKWLYGLKEHRSLHIPRCLFIEVTKQVRSVQIHGFCDSSQQAYTALCYLRIEAYGMVVINLLTAKAKVAPLKKQTVPRLELLGCLMFCKLVNSVKNAINSVLHIERIYYWTDSRICLSWIHGVNKEWKCWVENRVHLIRSLSKIDD